MGERGVETIEDASTASRCDRPQRASGTQSASVDARVEHREVSAGRRDAIPVAARDAFNETMQPESAEIVRHRARRIGVRIAPLQLRDVIAEVPMSKACGCEGEETEGVHERVDATVPKAEPGGPLIVDENG